MAVFYTITSRNSVRNYLRKIRLFSVGFLAIWTKASLAMVIFSDTSLEVIVSMRVRAGWRSSAGMCLRSNRKLNTYIEDHHCPVKVYMLNL